MRDRTNGFLITTIILAAIGIYLALPMQHPKWLTDLLFWQPASTRDLQIKEGLDLRGGLQVLLEADVPAGQTVDREAIQTAKQIVENRVNGLGVSEPLIQVQGDRRIVVELPGISNPDQAIETLKGTGLLEFIETGDEVIPAGTKVSTSYGSLPDSGVVTSTNQITSTNQVTRTNQVTSTSGITSTTVVTPTTPATPGKVYRTIMTGADLKTAAVAFEQSTNAPIITFTLTDAGSKKFADYTSANIGKILSIVLDKTVLSSPRIQSAITGGNGQITGRFTLEEARSLSVQMRYGALPVPLRVAESRAVGPTLGQDSVRKSINAGVIGLLVVILFMLLYYRLPGVLADLALIIYALLVFALFKLIPVTLTLPGIAGFVLSVGMAVDANVLIFERMKEELRGGRNLRSAIDTGFARAWPSIRDSNASTLITCVILFWFGSNFGASIVKGFALTLAIGVLVSLFTAITVTRTFLHLVMNNMDLSRNHWWFGV